MNPEEKELTRRALELSEENHRILLKIDRAMHWYKVWSIVKVCLLVLPFIFGYVYLKPYVGSIGDSLSGVSELIKSFR